jgi:hypothetical protein
MALRKHNKSWEAAGMSADGVGQGAGNLLDSGEAIVAYANISSRHQQFQWRYNKETTKACRASGNRDFTTSMFTALRRKTKSWSICTRIR